MPFFSFSLLLFIIVSFNVATIFAAGSAILSTQSPICRTSTTTKPQPTVITSTTTSTAVIRQVVTITVTPTVTRPAKTVTNTETSSVLVTVSASGDVSVSSTTTVVPVTVTESVTTANILVVSANAIDATSTVTISAPSGFIYPVPTASSQKRLIGRRKSTPRVVSNLDKDADVIARHVLRAKMAPPSYPYRVTCSVLVQSIVQTTVTKTASKTVTMTPPTTTKYATATVTQRTTVYGPDSTVTSTFATSSYVTSTVTTTVTSTSTQTSLSYVATSTYYAVCGPQNQVSTDYNGNALALTSDNSPDAQQLEVDTAYDCCMACMNTPNCAGSNFIAALVGAGVNCELAIYDTCLANQAQIADTYTTQSFIETTFSNGLCGHYVYQ